MEIAKGLEGNGLLRYSHLLTGYVGNAETLAAVVSILKKIREVGDKENKKITDKKEKGEGESWRQSGYHPSKYRVGLHSATMIKYISLSFPPPPPPPSHD